jgi:hypothetical protein
MASIHPNLHKKSFFFRAPLAGLFGSDAECKEGTTGGRAGGQLKTGGMALSFGNILGKRGNKPLAVYTRLDTAYLRLFFARVFFFLTTFVLLDDASRVFLLLVSLSCV